jgi:hypothetical protein
MLQTNTRIALVVTGTVCAFSGIGGYYLVSEFYRPILDVFSVLLGAQAILWGIRGF